MLEQTRKDDNAIHPAAGCTCIWRRPVVWLVLVLLVCAGVRVWAAEHAEVIAKDGVIYLEMARLWGTNPHAVVQGYDYPPGYPVAVAVTHGLLTRAGLTDRLELWEYSGRLISMLAAIASMAALWVLARAAFSPQIAAMTVLLFGVSRKWTYLGVDTLSDSLAVAFQLWATVGLWKMLSLLKQRPWLALLTAAGAGVLIGCGYLVRPESVWLLPIAALVCLWWCIRRRSGWGTSLASLVLMGGCALAVGLPYMKAIGGFSQKDSFEKVLGYIGEAAAQNSPTPPPPSRVDPLFPPAPAAVAASLADSSIGQWAPMVIKPTFKIVSRLFEGMSPILGVGLVIWICWLALKRWVPQAAFASAGSMPAGAYGPILIAAAVVVVPVLVLLYIKSSYISHRHIMFLSALASPLASAGIVVTGSLAAAAVPAFAKRPHAARHLTALIACVVFVALTLVTVHASHTDKGYLQDAGLYVRSAAAGGDRLLTTDLRIGHYSQIPYKVLNPAGLAAPATFWTYMAEGAPAATLVALSQKDMNETEQGRKALAQMAKDPRLAAIGTFVQEEGASDRVMVFRVRAAQTQPAP
ncbi:MAG: glycosyltransferase family 39 protein [Planctomycetaceae bacterium]|nr:glycosyltransferase family 39 protein [Planctomycetaceae bacterium]